MILLPATSQIADGNWPEDCAAAKARFMAEIAGFVDAGHGELIRPVAGTLVLRLTTGEVYHLAECSITRVA